MFDISNEGLEGALDRMASVFISPLFAEDCVEREMQAINSENDRYQNLDQWRKMHLEKLTSKPGHQYNQFGVGNLDTLGKEPGARDELIKFHNQYYSSNIMTLCVLSKHPLTTMQEWVTKYFS